MIFFLVFHFIQSKLPRERIAAILFHAFAVVFSELLVISFECVCMCMCIGFRQCAVTTLSVYNISKSQCRTSGNFF